MKYNFKKSLLGKAISLLAVICMLMALVSAATYDIQGDNALYAPPVGKKSAVTYTLLEGETPVTDAVLTISPADGASAIPEGVSVYNNKVLLDGTTIQAGSFKVIMTSASDTTVTASKEITVDGIRIFWDFDDIINDAGVSKGSGTQYPLTKLDGTSWTHTGTGSAALWYAGKVTGGYMGNNTTNNTIYFHNLWGQTETKVKPSQLTIDTDISVSSKENLKKYVDSGGAWSAGWTEEGKLAILEKATDVDITLGEWNNLNLTIDYNAHTIIPSVNGVKSANTYDLVETDSNANKSYKELRVVSAYSPTDNVAVYSGEPVYDSPTLDGTAYDIQGDNALYAPPVGKKSAVTYKLLADGVEVTDAVLTISPADGSSAIPAGVSVYNNKVLLDGTTIQAGSFKVTMKSASDSSKTCTEEMTIDNVRIFWDFENVVDAHTLKTLSGGTEIITSTTSRGWTDGSITTSDGNSYMQNGTKNSMLSVSTMIENHTTNKKSPKYVTVDFDMKIGSADWPQRFGENKVWGVGYTANGKLVAKAYNGTESVADYTDIKVYNDEWNNFQVTLDYDKHTMRPAANGVAGNEYTFSDDTTTAYDKLYKLRPWLPIDNVAIYSGEPVYENNTPAIPEDGVIVYDNGEKIVAAGNFSGGTAVGENYRTILAYYDEEEKLLTTVMSDPTEIEEGNNSVYFEGEAYFPYQKVTAYVWTEDTLVPLCEPASDVVTALKVLAIGNSFSQDAMTYLYQIAENSGEFDIIQLANAFYAGCELEEHMDHIANDSAVYSYEVYSARKWTGKSQTLETILKDNMWNLITLQQYSGYSGLPETYECLPELISWVNENKTNPHAKLAWHMTWAYPADKLTSNNNYTDQSDMYDKILSTVESEILTNEDISFIIPSGTAIQNLRTSDIGEHPYITRDTHLGREVGRCTAGLTWFKKITGLSTDNITYMPGDYSESECGYDTCTCEDNDTADVNEETLPIIKKCVNAAVSNPFRVTQYTE